MNSFMSFIFSASVKEWISRGILNNYWMDFVHSIAEHTDLMNIVFYSCATPKKSDNNFFVVKPLKWLRLLPSQVWILVATKAGVLSWLWKNSLILISLWFTSFGFPSFLNSLIISLSLSSVLFFSSWCNLFDHRLNTDKGSSLNESREPLYLLNVVSWRGVNYFPKTDSQLFFL